MIGVIFWNFLDFMFLFRFDRDWKKIEDFVGSKTVIQVLRLVFLG